MSKLRYRPEVDGLRTIAVIPVILFHLNSRWLPGGFTGVDVFFVISGYLITSLLMKELAEGTFSMIGFWIRRIRRLMPALATMILATLIVGRFVLWPSEWKFLGTLGASAMLSGANFTIWSAIGNYWGPSGEDAFLLHTWSLSVEEQFYLFYPMTLAILYRYARPRMRAAILAATVVSFMLCIVGLARSWTSSFYMLPMRGWELGVGGVLAMTLDVERESRKATAGSRILAVVGLLGIVASCFLVSEKLGFPGYQALLPVMSTLLVLAYCTETDGWAGRVLASAPFVYIGKASYSLYLWHWPVLVFTRACERMYAVKFSTWETVTLIALCSGVSYHLVERIGKARNAWRVYVPILFVACLGLSAKLYHSRGNYSSFETVEWRGQLYDVTPVQQRWTGAAKDRMDGIVAPMRPDKRSDAFSSGGLIRKYGGDVPSVMVLGDSHALMWASTIDNVCRDLGLSVSFEAAAGTPPLFYEEPLRVAHPYFTADEQYAFDKSRLEAIRSWKPRVIILVSCWENYIQYEEPLRTFIELLGSSGSTVLLIEQPPRLYFGDRSALQAATYLKTKGDTNDTIATEAGASWSTANAMLHKIARSIPRCEVIAAADLYEAGQGQSRLLDRSRLLYIDDDHLSDFGAHLAEARIKTSISGVLGKSAQQTAEKTNGKARNNE
jgi:peptidoglycan/LPS O-acetylase OafA/YrhL